MSQTDPLADHTPGPGWDQTLSDAIDHLEDAEQRARQDGNAAAADTLADLRDMTADGIPS